MKILLAFLLFIFVLDVNAQNNTLNFKGLNNYVNLDAIAAEMAGENSYTIEY